jgi:hypothetical protein
MHPFTMTVMALAAFAAMLVTAQGEIGGGAPMRNGEQCFTYSPSWNLERQGGPFRQLGSLSAASKQE